MRFRDNHRAQFFMTRVKRLFMTADTVSDVWLYTLELAAGLATYGIEVTVAAIGPALSVSQRAAARRLKNLELLEAGYKVDWAKPWQQEAKQAGEWALEIAERVRPQIVQLNQYLYSGLAWNYPVVVVAHNLQEAPSEVDLGGLLASSEYQRRITNGLKRAVAVTASSNALLLELKQRYGTFAAVPPIHAGRSIIGGTEGAKHDFVLAVLRGNGQKEKLRQLINVAKYLSWPMFILGELNEKALESESAQRGITLLGDLRPESVQRWFSRASFFIEPADNYELNFSALDAAISGCALVLADTPDFRRVWGKTAIYAAPGSGIDFAAAVNRLIACDYERRRLAIRSKNRAFCFSRERMASKYFQLYQRVLARQALAQTRLMPCCAKS